MNYKELLFDTLEKLGTSKTNLGYDYIVYGLLTYGRRPSLYLLYYEIFIH